MITSNEKFIFSIITQLKLLISLECWGESCRLTNVANLPKLKKHK